MKKLAFILALLPALAAAFPVYTNRLDFNPAESTGQFDDFLWRWSGFDDQAVEMIFPNVDASSGVGFRLAYPQRGRVFLDLLPPAVTSVFTVVTKRFPEIYTNLYPDVYATSQSLPQTNITITRFFTNDQFGTQTITTNVITFPLTSNLVYASTKVVYTQNAAVVQTEPYGLITNSIGESNQRTITYVTNAVFRYAVDPILFNGQLYYQKKQEENAVSSGFVEITNITTRFLTNTIFNNGMNTSFVVRVQADSEQETLPFSFVTNNLYTVKISATLSWNTNSGANWRGFVDVPWQNSIIAEGLANTRTFIATSPTVYVKFRTGISLTYEDQNDTNLVSFLTRQYNNLPIGQYSYEITTYTTSDLSLPQITQSVFVDTNFTVAATNEIVYAFPSTPRVSRTYSETTFPATRVTFNIPRLSVPPDGPYFAEVLTYSGADPTNATQSRTLAKGQVTIENSIWAVTNYAGYTNFPGPWDYLLNDGSRAMTDNFNAGGYGVTNIGLPGLVFSNGTSITASNVALWNNFIQGTNVGLTVSTVFDGSVTGVWDNLTLKKDALVDMDFVDFDTTYTTAGEGRLVATETGSLQFGLVGGNVNVDIGHELLAYVRNGEANQLNDGEVVYFGGNIGDVPLVFRASATNEFQCRNLAGVVTEPIAADGFGRVTWYGQVRGLDIDPFTVYTNSTILYLSTVPGQFTNVPPQPPDHRVVLGRVERNQSSGGGDIIHVQIDIGEHLEYLHDVNVNSATTNDLLIYNGTVWTNYARTNLSGIYLPLAGGTMSGDISFQDSYKITQITDVTWNQGQRISFEEKIIYGDNWSFDNQPTIPGYLTSTGAAATYVNLTNLPAGIVTTNNLSTIAGSGLGVVSNQLVVTNYLPLTGGNMSGDLSRTNFGAVQSDYKIEIGQRNAASSSWSSYAALVAKNGNSQAVTGGEIRLGNANDDYWYLGLDKPINGLSIGQTTNKYASINESGLFFSKRVSTPTRSQEIVFRAGDNILDHEGRFGAIVSGPNLFPVWYESASQTNAKVLYGSWNFNAASYVTVTAGNENYWRITTAPTGATSSGSSGQMAVSGTNLFIYSPNALGVGTARWLRVSGDVSW